MQLHRLAMTAIGPFAGSEVIDFARLGTAGLFLLEGPTGSGKSTIIDAITFALYGKVAQASADVERIHSHHADPQTIPVVTLVFETQSGLYRVRRTPRFERPKKSGTGTTTQQPSVKLWRITTPDDLEGGDLLSTNIGDCDDEITRAVGLTRDQFVQTVILPQGEFATFLRARSEDKGKLLEKVFGTAFFRRVQDSIVEAGKAALARRQGAVTEIRDAVHSCAVSAGLDDQQRDALVAVGQSSPDDLTQQLAEIVDELATRERHARKASREATERHVQMADMVGEARLRMQRRERLLELQRKDENLAQRAVEFNDLRQEVARARQARPVAGAIRTLANSEAALKRAEAALNRCRLRVEPELRDADTASLRAAARQARETIGSLAAAIRIESGLAARAAARQGEQRALEACQLDLDATASEVASLPERIAELETALTEARRLHALLDPRTEEARRARLRLDAASSRARVAATIPALEQAAAGALSKVRDGERSLAALRQARIDGIAGELGLALDAGEPCPVCGSTEHPSPARPTDDAVTPQQISAEEQRVERLRGQSDAGVERLAAAQAELRELAAAADGLDVDGAQQAAEQALRRLDESTRAGTAVIAAGEQLAALRQRGEALTARARQLTADRARLQQALADLDHRIEQEQAQVDEARDGCATVAARRDRMTASVSVIEELLEAIGAHQAAAASVAEDTVARDADLAQAGFATVAEWADADRRAEWITAKTKEIDDFERAITEVRAGLSGPELADVQLDSLFDDLPQMVSLAKAAKEEMERESSELGRLTAQLAMTRQRVKAVAAAVERNAAVIAETADAVRVGQLVAGNGDNQLNLDLAKYVLIRRFSEVLSAANAELARFSGGRYTLEHTDEKQGNAKSGLGVRVHDLHTNQVREVGTLSGGETFYVSLSLALALAEVVRAESGGVDLGTLFVDEGFGTLDPDVLDDVMQTLEGLREGGRTVGIVSHVSELKSRVADRVEVIVRPDRTSTLRVTA